MTRRSIVALVVAFLLTLIVVVPSGAVGKDDVMQYKAFRDVATTRLNAWAAGVNNRDATVIDNFTTNGATTFFGSKDPTEVLGSLSTVEIVSIDHVISSADLTSIDVTASIIGLSGRFTFTTQEFMLLRQMNGDYLIDSIQFSGAVIPRGVIVVDLEMTVTNESVIFSGESRDAEFIRIRVFNKTAMDVTVALYPSGVSITDPTQMVGRLEVTAGQTGEITLARLLPGSYVVANAGHALGTLNIK